MSVLKYLLSFVLAFGGYSSQALSSAKTLITYDAGKITPAIAKSWKKSKGSYTFVLDKTADIGQGTKSITSVVKKSLESRLGESHGVKVTEKGKTSVVIAYTGEEKAFLEALGQTRVRAEQNVEIAMESTESQGGVRAKTTERDPVDGEVKGTIVKTSPTSIVVRVVVSSPITKSLGINDGDKVEVETANFAGQKGDPVFFTPTQKVGSLWKSSAVSGK